MQRQVDQARLARPFALMLAGVGVSALAAVSTGPTPGYRLALAVTACLYLVFAGWLWRHRGDHPRWLFPLAVATMTLSVTVTFYPQPPGRNGHLLAYLWTVPFIFHYFSRRQILAQTAFMLVGAFTVLLLHSREAGYPITDNRVLPAWLFFTATVLVVGGIVRNLGASLERNRARAVRSADRAAEVARVSSRALQDVAVPHLQDDVARTSRTLLDADGAAVFHVDTDSGGSGCRFTLVTTSGWDAVTAGELDAADVDLVDGAVPGVGPDIVALPDSRADQALTLHPALVAAGAVGIVCAPVLSGGRVRGALVVFTRTPRHFDEDDGQTLTSLAALLGLVIDRQVAQRELEHQARHDPLTQLPNRTLFLENLTGGLARAGRNGGHLAVLLLDLDQFKLVNDSLGHAAGDQLLRAVAVRLSSVLRTSDTLARLGGDEFTVVLQDLARPEEAVTVARHLQAAFAAPIDVDGHPLVVSASIGVAVTTGSGGKVAGELLREADAAMYHAKTRRRGQIEVFDERLRTRVTRRLALETELRQAIAARDIQVAYQPVVEARSGRTVGAEALARWSSRRFGAVPPEEFIELAEDAGLIDALSDLVFQRAFAAAARWRQCDPDFTVAVNVTPRQLQQRSFAPRLAARLAGAGLPAAAVTLEITESALGGGLEPVLHSLRAAHDMGVRLALDDFGTGYSSMARLRELPLSVIKVDRSFIDDAGILETIAGLGRSLGLAALAEGVETPLQHQRVVSLGFRYAQGYLWGRPVSEDGFSPRGDTGAARPTV